MISYFGRILLVSTSVAPIFLTMWFREFSKNWKIFDGLIYLVVASILVFLCLFVVAIARRKLEKIPVQISTIATADKEIVSFILIYLLPLVNSEAFDINIRVLLFVIVLFFITILTTHSYHFNPILGIFGFHFYQITLSSGLSYVLITRKNITNSKQISSVAQISEYIIVETLEFEK